LPVKVLFSSFPCSAWECVAWRLRLHYHGETKPYTGQSPVGMGSQAEPGNQKESKALYPIRNALVQILLVQVYFCHSAANQFPYYLLCLLE
jgi:hypothetical protein